MRLDTEYYTHAKREATNWVTCLYLPVIHLISTMHADHWGMGGRGNEITVSRTEHSGVLGKGFCSSKEGVFLSLLTNALKRQKQSSRLTPQPCNDIHSANGLYRKAGKRWVYWMQRKHVVGFFAGCLSEISSIYTSETRSLSLHSSSPSPPHCFFFRTGVHSPVKSCWSVVQPSCRK